MTTKEVLRLLAKDFWGAGSMTEHEAKSVMAHIHALDAMAEAARHYLNQREPTMQVDARRKLDATLKEVER